MTQVNFPSTCNGDLPPALVLPTYINGLAVVRNLGRAGVRVIAGNTSEKSFLGRASCYASDSVIYPDPRHYGEAFCQWMEEFAEANHGAVVIPTRDDEAEYLSRLHEKLGDRLRLAVASKTSVRLCLEKQETYRLAEKLGISCPKTVYIPVGSEIPGQLDEFLLPCLVKPVRNCDFFIQFDRSKAFLCHSHDEVMARLHETLGAGYDMMVQEMIPGDDDMLWEYITCNDKDGHCLGELCCHKLCQNPPDLGVGCIRRSEYNEVVVSYSRQLFKSLSFAGIGETEFKYDHRDSKYKLIEINPRSVIQIGLAVRCGLEMPLWLYRSFAGLELPANSSPARDGVYWIHGGGILRAMTRPSKSGRWRYVGNFIRSVFCKHCWAIWFWGDFGPAWQDIWGRVIQQFRKR
jgi:D-aspartate ligase